MINRIHGVKGLNSAVLYNAKLNNAKQIYISAKRILIERTCVGFIGKVKTC